jgi:hypothetical protein
MRIVHGFHIHLKHRFLVVYPRIFQPNSSRPIPWFSLMRSDLTPSAARRRAGGWAHRCTDFGGRLRAQREGRGDQARLSAGIRRFSTWCEAVIAAALPATPATVAAYLAALADLRLKISTFRAARLRSPMLTLAGFETGARRSISR